MFWIDCLKLKQLWIPGISSIYWWFPPFKRSARLHWKIYPFSFEERRDTEIVRSVAHPPQGGARACDLRRGGRDAGRKPPPAACPSPTAGRRNGTSRHSGRGTWAPQGGIGAVPNAHPSLDLPTFCFLHSCVQAKSARKSSSLLSLLSISFRFC